MDAPFLQLNTMALVGMSPTAKGMDSSERQLLVKTIIVESLTVVMPYMEKSGPAFELKSNLGIAEAPE
jgi:hypothetical protein